MTPPIGARYHDEAIYSTLHRTNHAMDAPDPFREGIYNLQLMSAIPSKGSGLQDYGKCAKCACYVILDRQRVQWYIAIYVSTLMVVLHKYNDSY